MTTELELASLADRVEALSGPNRLVDAEIACAVKFAGLRPATPWDFAGKYGYTEGNIKVEHGFLMAASYTRSLDAAMTLIDGNTFFHISRFGDGAEAHVYPNRYVGDDYTAAAATPALALCSAALRAHSTLSTGDEK